MGKWSSRIIGAILCLIGTATGGLAADKTDPGPQPASDRNWQVGFTPSYSSGNYGTNTTSTFFSAPVSIRRFFRYGDVSVVIPFVTATTDGRTTLVGGTAFRVDDGGGSNSGQGGGGGGGSVDDGGCSGKGSNVSGKNRVCGTTSRAAGQKVTTSGIGDIIIRGRYYVVEEKDWTPQINVTGRLKLPTASASQGLGTGEMDEGVGMEVSKLLGEKFITFLDGGYNVIGRPEGVNLRNQHWYDVGAGYYVTNDLMTSVYFEEYRSLVSGRQNARDVFFAMNYRAASGWRFNGGVTVGLSNGAPDYGLSTGISYRF